MQNNMKRMITLCCFLFAIPLSVRAQGDTQLIDNNVGASALAVQQGPSLVIEGSQSSPYLPGSVTGPTHVPGIFNGPQPTHVQVKSSLWLQKYAFRIAEEGTKSFNRTDITYAFDDPDLIAKEKGIQKGQTHVNGTVLFGRLAEGAVRGYVVGSLQVSAQGDDANTVNFNTLRTNAESMIAGKRSEDRFKGYTVRLMAIPQMVAVNYGVDGKSKGFSLAPVVSGLFSGGPIGAISTVAGLAAGASTSGGRNVYIAMEGTTFLVVMEHPDAPVVDVMQGYVDVVSLVNNPLPVSRMSDTSASDIAKKLELAK